MKLKIIKVGKPTTSESRALAERYLTRLKPFVPMESIEWKESEFEKNVEKLGGPGKWVVALDERGKEFSSKEMAQNLKKWLDDPAVKELVFIIGGPYGLGDAGRGKANALWSLSRGTFASDLAWVIAVEQLYRAFTILKGMPYHHE